MSTNYSYKGDDIAKLSAKCCGEKLTGVTSFIDHKQSDFSYSGTANKRY
jgi:hypothetical protein